MDQTHATPLPSSIFPQEKNPPEVAPKLKSRKKIIIALVLLLAMMGVITAGGSIYKSLNAKTKSFNAPLLSAPLFTVPCPVPAQYCQNAVAMKTENPRFPNSEVQALIYRVPPKTPVSASVSTRYTVEDPKNLKDLPVSAKQSEIFGTDLRNSRIFGYVVDGAPVKNIQNPDANAEFSVGEQIATVQDTSGVDSDFNPEHQYTVVFFIVNLNNLRNNNRRFFRLVPSDTDTTIRVYE